jgi:DUF2947 family protein
MTSPTEEPAYRIGDLAYDDLRESHFGSLLIDNSVDIEALADSIRVLSERSANQVWILTFGDARYKADIDASNWTYRLAWDSCGDWLQFYNNADSKPVEQQLLRLVRWRQEQPVLFIRGPCDCIFTDWKTFVQHWLSFAEYDDDGPFLIPVEPHSSSQTRVLSISPNGWFLRGSHPGS